MLVAISICKKLTDRFNKTKAFIPSCYLLFTEQLLISFTRQIGHKRIATNPQREQVVYTNKPNYIAT